MQLVWFKRDLRLNDHLPLFTTAEKEEKTLLLYAWEPKLFEKTVYSAFHSTFIAESLQEMRQKLAMQGHELYVLTGEMPELLDQIHPIFPFSQLLSYEEVGIDFTYQRDKAVKRWCQQKQVTWLEFPVHGVDRGRKNRVDWRANWFKRMEAPQNKPDLEKLSTVCLPKAFVAAKSHDLSPYLGKHKRQVGGENTAQRYLSSFLNERAVHYHKHISKPLLSRRSCSRLSPYLAWGNVSMKQLYQASRQAMVMGKNKRPLQAFVARLVWHCHFIQKFESECRIEFENLNRAFNTIRTQWNEVYFQAWVAGKTGFPLVDACMRCVAETGYLNFRMRAMVMSFLTHLLWLDWKKGADYLAGCFLDFEPGIHYAQCQMQAGVMGVNTIRTYNPVKQAREHDGSGEFVRLWVKELAHLPTEHLFEPWLMTPFEQTAYACTIGVDYPAPIIDLKTAAAHARKVLWATKASPVAKAANKRILKKHVHPPKKQKSA